MSVHNEQVASVLRRAVQEVVNRGLNDPRVRGMISVTSVRVSTDLADATVLVSVLPAEQAELTLHGLRHAARHIRTEVGKRVKVRRMPRLAFKIDETLKREASIYAAINDAVRNDGEAPARDDEQDPHGEGPCP